VQGHIVIPDANLSAVLRELPRHIELTQKEDGCLIFKVLQDTENKNVFTVYEEFINRSAFETHQERVKCSYWGEVTKAAERHYQINECG
jgi:quinol monooxygenase YgiN